MPYNVSLVDLDEGPRLISNVIDYPPDQVKIGMVVEVVYEDNQGYTLPKVSADEVSCDWPATIRQTG